jgi:hypothetical protein
LAVVFLCISDGLGRAVYRLEQKAAISVGFFEQLSSVLPFSQYNNIRCYDIANPFTEGDLF